MANPFSSLTPAQNIVGQIDQQANGLTLQLTLQLAQLQNAVWNSPAATPDQIVAAMGTGAAAHFNAATALQTLLNTIAPGANTFTPPRAVTINTDGTATIAPAATPAASGGANAPAS
jgi:hypothetical protein